MAEEFRNIRGLSELQRQMEELPANIEKNISRGGMRAGIKVMHAEAVRLAPEWTGRLKRGIRFTVRYKNGRIEALVIAGGRSKETTIINVDGRPKMVYVQPFWAKFVEDGTAAHRIQPKNGKALAFGGGLLKSVEHPGSKPKPFMRPAFDGKWNAAVEALGDYIRRRLPRALRKYR